MTTKSAWLFSKSSFVLLFIFLLACSSRWKAEVPSPEPFPVVIRNLCDGAVGSGVLVGNTVYTAYHVVEDCPFAAVYNDDLNFGGPASLVDYNEDMDTATLVFNEAEGPLVPIAKPKLGPVCTHNSHPEDERKCGRITKIEEGRWGLYLDFKVIPGNSGSPLYQDGKLVGVVAARWPWRGSPLE
jgi:S1-C subfamily serine protease